MRDIVIPFLVGLSLRFSPTRHSYEILTRMGSAIRVDLEKNLQLSANISRGKKVKIDSLNDAVDRVGCV